MRTYNLLEIESRLESRFPSSLCWSHCFSASSSSLLSRFSHLHIPSPRPPFTVTHEKESEGGSSVSLGISEIGINNTPYSGESSQVRQPVSGNVSVFWKYKKGRERGCGHRNYYPPNKMGWSRARPSHVSIQLLVLEHLLLPCQGSTGTRGCGGDEVGVCPVLMNLKPHGSVFIAPYVRSAGLYLVPRTQCFILL